MYRVMEFDQKPCLETNIDFNTGKKTAPKNAFEKDIFKLMNNSVFGKTMDNLYKRCSPKIITNENRVY